MQFHITNQRTKNTKLDILSLGSDFVGSETEIINKLLTWSNKYTYQVISFTWFMLVACTKNYEV